MSKTQLKESESLNKALIAMEAINKIFWDHLFYGNKNAPEGEKGLLKFDSVVVFSPFKLMDLEHLKNAVQTCQDEKILLPIVEKIKALARQSLTLYNEFEGKQTLNRKIYYKIHDGKINRVPIKTLERLDFIDKHQDKQVFNFGWEWEFKDYCEGVNKFVSDVLEAYRRKIQDRLIKKPKATTEPTAAQIALFFYYLGICKDITPPPGRKFFFTEEKHKEPPYNFDVSGQKVYLFYLALTGSKNKTVTLDDVLTIQNLKAVIPMLKKYPVAQSKAKDDYYDIGITH
jgi:hypothetical protein